MLTVLALKKLIGSLSPCPSTTIMCCIVGEREGSLRRLEGDVLMPSVAVADEDTTGKLTKSTVLGIRASPAVLMAMAGEFWIF